MVRRWVSEGVWGLEGGREGGLSDEVSDRR